MRLSNETKIMAISHYLAYQSAWVSTVSDPEYLRGAPDGFIDDIVKVKMQIAECEAWLEEYTP